MMMTTNTVGAELTRMVELLTALTWRDLRVRYRQSALGIAWAVVLPLTMMLLFTFVFTRAIHAPALDNLPMPYALYAFAGLVPWTFFANSLTGALNSLVANRNLVTKVYFPREVFPLSSILSALVDYVVAMHVLVVLMIYFHVRGQWVFQASWALLLLPGIVMIQIVLTAGLGLLLAMSNLFYRDVRLLFTALLQLWMFLSAVVVPLPTDGSLTARCIALNPMLPIIHAYRDTLLLGRVPEIGGILYAGLSAAILLTGGWIWFRRASYRFAECI